LVVRAFHIQSDQPVLTPDAPEPARLAGWAIVEPTLVLITESDIDAVRNQRHDTILGHQFVGRVVDADDESLMNQRVVADVNITDPQSVFAQRGIGQHDPDRSILGLRNTPGCLSERFQIPQRNLYVVPEEVEDERAVFASQLAAAIHVSRIERIVGKTFVTVLGGDLSALLIAQIMSSQNASVRLLTSRPDRLELCAKWGIKHRDLSEVGRRADQDIVIDTLSETDSISSTLAMARPRGAVILQNHPVPAISDAHMSPTDLTLLIERELRVSGSRCGTLSDGIDALQSGSIDLSGLITKRVRFDEVMSAMRAAIEPEHIAVLVQMQ
jgi:threonine dehydrogenase-like Zn-dependent dehydrogenase